MEDADAHKGYLLYWGLGLLVSLSAVGSAIFGLNVWYVNWHDTHNDTRYVQKKEFQLAQAVAIENSNKLDAVAKQTTSIQVLMAVAVVGSFQQEYDRQVRANSRTIVWEVERDRLKQQLDRAIGYRDCLMAERATCEQLRGW